MRIKARLRDRECSVRRWHGSGREGYSGGPMIEIQHKLQRLVKVIETERGPFALFGVFMREDSPGRWDLVLSAPWLEHDNLEALRDFAGLLKKAVGVERLLSFSRIVTLDRGDAVLEAILREVGTARPPLERDGHNLFGLPIEHAYILRARRPAPPSSKRTRRTTPLKRRAAVHPRREV